LIPIPAIIVTRVRDEILYLSFATIATIRITTTAMVKTGQLSGTCNVQLFSISEKAHGSFHSGEKQQQ